MVNNMQKRTVVVTGGARGIGLGIVRKFIDLGCRVSSWDIDHTPLEGNPDNSKNFQVQVDIADHSLVKTAVSKTIEELGGIDILINNAGFRASSPIAEMSTEEWRAAAAVNFDGPFFCTRAVVPGMISNGYGRIITVSGLNAFHGRPNWSHICGSKMGAIGMTRALATELAQYGILVNHVVPGAYVAHPDLNRIPLGRVGLAQELANTYAFRASEDASYITGQTFHVNGGEIRG